VATKTTRGAASVPEGYDPRDYPVFAVTVDVLVFTLVDDALHVLLVRRGAEPYAGRWAIPGGFKHPDETLDDAARRELTEETGIEAPAVLRQLGAYGDPGRDPRTNVVTVAYVAVVREVGDIVAGTDAAHAALVPVAAVLRGRVELAFDHDRIVRDALDRIRRDLEATGIATAFVGPTFTLAELRTVYEAVWDVHLDGANFRRSITAEPGWVVPTGKRATPGPAGGKPPELFKAGTSWKRGGPIRRPRRTSGRGVT
jgi:8-oxo-dGTP diphosphatase